MSENKLVAKVAVAFTLAIVLAGLVVGGLAAQLTRNAVNDITTTINEQVIGNQRLLEDNQARIDFNQQVLQDNQRRIERGETATLCVLVFTSPGEQTADNPLGRFQVVDGERVLSQAVLDCIADPPFDI